MSQPEQCPRSPIDSPQACSMFWTETGAQFITKINTCDRCGWVEPEALDRYFELAVKRTLSPPEVRTAMAIDGEPFTFVRSSEADITLDEALGQALGAASMCWEAPERAGIFNDQRAARIMDQLKKLLQEKAAEERRAIVEELVRNTH